MRQVKKSIIFFLLLGLSTLLFFGCDGGDGGTTGPSTTLNIAGTWDTTLTFTESTCREFPVGTSYSPPPTIITQTGNNIAMPSTDPPMAGTIVGDQATLEGSQPWGTKMIMKATVSADGRSMSGTVEKIGSGGDCSFKGTFTATKQ